jgi:hypothetical protein
MDFFESKWLFAIDFGISRADQCSLIDLALRKGSYTGPDRDTWEPMWIGFMVRQPDYSLKPQDIGLEHRGRWAYHNRYNPEIGWSWCDPVSQALIEPYLRRLAGLYRHITRVNVLIQRPGRELNAHRDLRAGEFYPDLQRPELAWIGNNHLRYIGDLWNASHAAEVEDGLHRRQRYLTLKFPLSEREDDVGQPFVRLNGVTYVYDSKGRAFFLNEAQMEHGANPVSFHRGVVFVDGILNMDVLDQLPQFPIDCRVASDSAGLD